jgi:hypothetical protein
LFYNSLVVLEGGHILKAGKKYAACFIAILLAFGSLEAQEMGPDSQADIRDSVHWYFGLSGGYANNWLYTSTGTRAFTEYKNGDGFEISVPVRYQVTPWFALQGEIQYIQKNYIWSRTEQYSKIYTETTNSFVDFPLMAQFSFGGPRLRGFLNAGGYIGFWAAGRRKGTEREYTVYVFDIDNSSFYYDFDEKYEFDKERDNRFDAGLLCGIGLQYELKPCVVFVEGRFNYGLTDLQKDYQYGLIPRINNTVAVQIGVLFNQRTFTMLFGEK